MKSANAKDIFRQIRFSPRRFLAILAIVALGVSFFAGVRAACPDMRLTLDRYYNKQNAFDFRLISTMGFSEEDISALEKDFSQVQPGYMLDAFADIGGKSRLLHLSSYDLSSGEKSLNQPDVLEGRLPQTEGECIADKRLATSYGLKVGDTLTLDSSDSDVSDGLSQYSYTVVGIARSVSYISVERGTSTKGSGSVDGFLLIPQSNFLSSVYTDVYLKLDNADGVSRFSDAYDALVTDASDTLSDIAKTRAPLRLESVRAEAQAKLDDAKQQITDTETKLNDSAQQLADGRTQWEEGKTQLAEKQQEFYTQTAAAEAKLDDAKQQLADAQTQIDENSAKLEDGRAELNAGRIALEDARLKIASGQTELDSLHQKLLLAEKLLALLPSQSTLYEKAAAELAKYQTAYEEQQATLLAAQETYTSGVNTLSEKEQELFSGAAALESAKIQLAAAQKEYDSGVSELAESKASGEAELAAAQQTLTEKQSELEEGEAQLAAARQEAEPQLADARRQVTAGEDKLQELEEPEWHILDLSKNEGFESYKQDTDRIANIGLVFPIIFFLVAALVSLTNMTRMVEDDRVQIGTRKALGYGTMAIAAKYLIYAGIASVTGIVLGLTVGLQLFPRVIASAYGILYDLPSVSLSLTPLNSGIAALGALLCSIFPAYLACWNALRSTPASLMRPRSPKEGKRILLERIPFLWNRLSFSIKVTCRNIFRYKKRLFMTIIGIAGCTALVFTAFGLRSSVDSLIPLQYEQIQKYDMLTGLKTDSADAKQQIQTVLDQSGNTKANMYLHMESVTAEASGKEKDATLIVATDRDSFPNFITLRKRIGKKPLELTDSGVILTEKLGKQLSLHKGDTMTFRDADGKSYTVPVLDTAENYVLNYIYMTPALYQTVFGSTADENAMFTQLSSTEATMEDTVSTALMDTGVARYVSFNTHIRENFSNMTQALDTVVLVLILSAAALAFVVLFSLTNINIDERARELATIKVLGFYDRETSMYIYRENIILTVLGTLLGLVLGVFLLMYVIVTAEVDMAMFARTVEWWNYLIAAGFTFFFSFLVNLFMHRVIKKIDMVESLKSIE